MGRWLTAERRLSFQICDHTMEAFTLAFYIYNIYYIMYIFFKKKDITGGIHFLWTLCFLKHSFICIMKNKRKFTLLG